MPVETEEQVETTTETAEAVEAPAGDGGSEVVTQETPAAKTAADTAKLEATVGSLLSKAFKEEDAKNGVEDEAGEQPAEETPAEEEQVEEEAAAAVAPVTVTPAGTPTLPASYRRSLLSRGYTDQEIDTDLKNMGTRFVEMAERVHRGRAAEITDWAAQGRAEKARQAQQPQQAPQLPDGALPKLDAAALKATYGDDKLIDALVGPVNAAIDRINAATPIVQQQQKASQTAVAETLVRHVSGFFASDELKPFAAIYGDNASFAKDQTKIDARNNVLQTADALMAGASLQGRSLSLDEALTLAHDSLSSNYKIQAARTQITEQLQKRNRGITLKPGGRANNPTGHNGSATTTQRKVGALLDKAFGPSR